MKILKNLLKFLGILLLVLGITYFLGPKSNQYPSFDGKINAVDIPLGQLEPYIAEQEAKVDNIKPNNQSRLIWADSIKKTDYALVYLHGFSASPMEGDPIHQEFASRYGCNLYIPRLAGHGIDSKESFADLSPKDLIESAKEAIAIGRLIGDKVILMSCSTGSTLSIYLAGENPELVDALMMYSPNIDLAAPESKLLTKQWGLQIARQMIGEYRHLDMLKGTDKEQYTTTSYRVEALVCLRDLLDKTMTVEQFGKIKQPFLLGYYYKSETEHDQIISMDAIKLFDRSVATSSSQKMVVPFANVANHVIPSSLYTKDQSEVRKANIEFAENILRLVPTSKKEKLTIQ